MCNPRNANLINSTIALMEKPSYFIWLKNELLIYHDIQLLYIIHILISLWISLYPYILISWYPDPDILISWYPDPDIWKRSCLQNEIAQCPVIPHWGGWASPIRVECLFITKFVIVCISCFSILCFSIPINLFGVNFLNTKAIESY